MLSTSPVRFALATAGAFSLAFATPAVATPAFAQSAPREAAEETRENAAEQARDPDRMICVRAQLTGSRLNRQICRTQREWDEDGGVPTRR